MTSVLIIYPTLMSRLLMNNFIKPEGLGISSFEVTLPLATTI